MNKLHNVQNRQRARELAVQFLYSLDTRPGQDPEECLTLFISEEGFAAEESAAVEAYMKLLVRGTWSRRADIDKRMRRILTGWRPERMVAVDRAVLRVAVFEGFLEKTVPFAVAISEAVRLAKTFGTENSPKFVNGVLARIAQKEANDATAVSADSTDRR